MATALLGYRHHHEKNGKSWNDQTNIDVTDAHKSRKSKINAINGKYRWNDWSRRKPLVRFRLSELGIENFRHAGNNNKI